MCRFGSVFRPNRTLFPTKKKEESCSMKKVPSRFDILHQTLDEKHEEMEKQQQEENDSEDRATGEGGEDGEEGQRGGNPRRQQRQATVSQQVGAEVRRQRPNKRLTRKQTTKSTLLAVLQENKWTALASKNKRSPLALAILSDREKAKKAKLAKRKKRGEGTTLGECEHFYSKSDFVSKELDSRRMRPVPGQHDKPAQRKVEHQAMRQCMRRKRSRPASVWSTVQLCQPDELEVRFAACPWMPTFQHHGAASDPSPRRLA